MVPTYFLNMFSMETAANNTMKRIPAASNPLNGRKSSASHNAVIGG